MVCAGFCKRLTALAAAVAVALTLSAVSFAEQEAGEQTQEALSPGQAAIDAVELAPAECRSAALQELVEDKVAELTDPEMDAYEKLKACYDYVAGSVRYGNHMAYLGTPIGDTSCADIFYTYGEMEGFGAVALTAGVGQCNAYAAAFILMAREIGFDAYLVEGGTLSAGGGYAYHKWAEIDTGDEIYVFDPQLEQDLQSWGLPAYSVFCKTYGELGRRYSRYM